MDFETFLIRKYKGMHKEIFGDDVIAWIEDFTGDDWLRLGNEYGVECKKKGVN